MSARYTSLWRSCRCLEVMRWISCIRRGSGARAIAETLETPAFHRLGQLVNQACDDAYYVPQQRAVGGVMNVRLHHRGIDPQLRAVLQAKIDRRLTARLADGPERVRRQPIGAAVERMGLGHIRAMNARELARRHSIRNSMTELADS